MGLGVGGQLACPIAGLLRTCSSLSLPPFLSIIYLSIYLSSTYVSLYLSSPSLGSS